MKKLMMIAALASAAYAGPIAVGGGWQEFFFAGVGSGANGNPYTFTATQTVVLKVTDAFNAGDRFEVFLGGLSAGQTSVPTALGDNIGNDYDGAFADARWSSGSWVLAPGNYSMELYTTVSPFASGRAAFRVDNAIPEPSTYAFVLSGLAAAFAIRRRK